MGDRRLDPGVRGREGDPPPAAAAAGSGTVTPEEAGLRLDAWLAARTGATRRRIATLVREGGARVDGRRAAPGMALRAGQSVRWEGDPGAPHVPVPEPGSDLVVLYSDADFLAVEKPAGIPTHPRSPAEGGTVVNALVARFPEVVGVGDGGLCPGLAHRLDRETSGLLLAARTPPAWEALRRAFASGEVRKTYLALVHGEVERPGGSTLPLRHSGPRGARMVPVRGDRHGGFPARTSWRPLGSGACFTLLEVEIETGLTHQIRAHLLAAGHPVAGDPLYAAGLPSPPGLVRLFLHAWRLAFPHPATGAPVRLESPLPDEPRRCLHALGIPWSD